MMVPARQFSFTSSWFLLDSLSSRSSSLSSLSQPLHLEPLCRLEELWQLLLLHVDLPLVHELDDGLHVRRCHVSHYDDGVLRRVLKQHSPEIGRAGREDHLVALVDLAATGDCHVREVRVVLEVLEGRGHIGGEVVVFEAELLVVLGSWSFLSHFRGRRDLTIINWITS